MTEPIFLQGICKDYLWGGNRLREEFGKESNADKIAESWELAWREPAAILRRLFIMFLFSTSSRRQSGESGLVCAAFARPVNPRKETMRLICPDTGAQVNCVRHLLYAC